MKFSLRKPKPAFSTNYKEPGPIVLPGDITGHIIHELTPLTNEILATGRQPRWSKKLADEELNPKVTRGYSQDTIEVDKLETPGPGQPFNLISSHVGGDRHKPVIDLDLPVRVIESSTPGNYHLYIDKELSWNQYKCLLAGFRQAGLIEEGWYNCSIGHKQSFVRPPHLKKPDYYDRLLGSLKTLKEA